MESFSQLLCNVEASVAFVQEYESCVHEDELSWQNCTFPDHRTCQQFYISYAKRHGFDSRIQWRGKMDTKGGATDCYNYLYYVCNKRGYRKNSILDPANTISVDSVAKAEMRKKRERPESRCGCLAEIKFKRIRNLDYFQIDSWISDHNHPLHPENQVHLLDRSINDAQAILAERHAQVRIPIRQSYQLFSRVAGGDENVRFRQFDLKNHLSSKRQLGLQHGEVDSDEQIASIFWADGIMRADYAAFGDVLSFDMTFQTNNLYRPLGCFIGFNHHRQMCVFGCALLFNEIADTFSWLFNIFFQCMSGKYLVSLMTDQCAAIRSAVNSVIPSSVYHGLCSWHICENAKKKLGAYANAKFIEELHFLIEEVDSPEEFEFNWDIIVKKYFEGKDVDQIKWLQFIKGYKEQWSSSWLKEYFTVGLKSTQLSESFNSLVRKYVKSFNFMLSRLRAIEIDSDFKGLKFFPRNHFPHSPLMQHASTVYTTTIFAKIHQEYEVTSAYYFDHEISEDVGSVKIL